ncbi:hypothetical protein MRP26_21100 [Bacillus sp. CCB-MMP212]|uniref:hypothetical protein n=1 Tax=Bacillus sp. CCB-MMP212 TaxID=2928002 RepID=UPI001F612306|nr:hypothetical protein [Bacillus sp. CCB-MMP212]MCI4251433.1 hypothetical protein [Bacillus sp. CCB-MMP212]
MFKKLVVGALETGIMLSGGIGASAASMENTESPVRSLQTTACELPSGVKKLSNGKYERYTPPYNGNFSNYYTEKICGGTMHWYFKGTTPDKSLGRYEGHLFL